jgi:hypothetical protein
MPTGMLSRLRRTSGVGEGERAASSVVLAVTAGVGVMIVLLSAAQGDLSPIVLPTAGLLVGIGRHAPVASAWFALVAWMTLLPLALGVAIVAPLMMIVVCLALAIGPERVLAWAETHLRLTTPRGDTDQAMAGWIEDDPRFS